MSLFQPNRPGFLPVYNYKNFGPIIHSISLQSHKIFE